MRILVTGSREWADTQAILLELRAVAEGESDVTLVHGGARGADQIAARWAENLGWTVYKRREIQLSIEMEKRQKSKENN